jgi:lipopolysaccharide/colanic/teichoic acid biosynthesis glycosyltransferase
MVHNAEQACGPKWSEADDPRVTRVGRILRISRLDEIAQLFNIIRGDMSLVGPADSRLFRRQVIGDDLFLRTEVLRQAGADRLGQINADYAASYEAQIEKFQYDLFYLENMS